MKLHTITYNEDMTIVIQDTVSVNNLDFLKNIDQSKIVDLTAKAKPVKFQKASTRLIRHAVERLHHVLISKLLES